MPNRKTGLNYTVFGFMGSAYIGDLVNATFTLNNTVVEGKGIADVAAFPILTGGDWSIEGELQIPIANSTYGFMGSATGAYPTTDATPLVGPVGTVLLATGGGSYSGTAVLTSVRHHGERSGVQTMTVTLTGRGPVTYA